MASFAVYPGVGFEVSAPSLHSYHAAFNIQLHTIQRARQNEDKATRTTQVYFAARAGNIRHWYAGKYMHAKTYTSMSSGAADMYVRFIRP